MHELIMENFNYIYHKCNLSVTYLIRRLLEEKRNILKETVLLTLFKSSVQIQKHEKGHGWQETSYNLKAFN